MTITETEQSTTMKAVMRPTYGLPDILELRDVERPIPANDEVRVRVHAASVNPVDWHMMTGIPYLARLDAGLRGPKDESFGVDFAGTVEAVGTEVTRLHPGDEVFGGRNGAFAEYLCVREERGIALKPASVTFEHAAAVPVAALTALQGLRDKGQLEPGQKVLINGASGGVGTFAVQIAKSLGAEVTGVCSTRNVDTARSLGADHVVDYTKDDFTRSGRRYDLMLDIAGNRSWSDYTRVLEHEATVVMVGGPKTNRWIGPLGNTLYLKLASLARSRRVAVFLAKLNREDLEFMGKLLEAGSVTPVIDRRYQLSEVPEALAYLGEGHAQGKVVITVSRAD
ncbi:MAG: NAD(P)-dependent alcohol dehydrogenase [Gaiellaceae bacterium]